MFPEAFIKRIKKQEYIDSKELLQSLQEPSPVSVRVNRDKWKQSPLDSEKVPWCRDGYYLSERPSFTLDPLFHAGVYYPQEASGMFLEQIIKQVAHEGSNLKILDLCGAPGGKATHLSSLAGKQGLIVANEVIRQRTNILAENITKWGLSNTLVTQADPSAFKNIRSFFDIILVDAPCSGEGMFRDINVVREWSEDNTILCAERQKRILMNIWSALKDNGILIYSTCTFNPAENEENIKWLCGKHEAESIRINIADYQGITEIYYKGVYGYGFYPGRIRGEGLFFSVLRKREKEFLHKNKLRSGTWDSLSEKEKAAVKEWTDLPVNNMMRDGNDIISVPYDKDSYLLLTDSMNTIKSGTKIFTRKKNDYIPSHDLALSVYFRKGIFPTSELDLPDALAYLSKKDLNFSVPYKGWNIVAYHDISLGFIKNLGIRINNYYPSHWRIRMNYEKPVDNIIKWG